MEQLTPEHLHEIIIGLLPIIIILIIWEAVWKLIALWKAAKNNHLTWFICIAIFNTIGILPIIYILMHRKKI
jgi:hypothetical protein